MEKERARKLRYDAIRRQFKGMIRLSNRIISQSARWGYGGTDIEIKPAQFPRPLLRRYLRSKGYDVFNLEDRDPDVNPPKDGDTCYLEVWWHHPPPPELN